MTKTEIDQLQDVYMKKQKQLDELQELLKKEYNTLRREKEMVDIKAQIEVISKEWYDAINIYRKAAESYWEKDYLNELGSSWRNFQNRDESIPKPVQHNTD